MEAILLAGGRAERLGPAARGRPKALVDVAGHPLALYQLGLLERAGVERAIVSCAAGQEDLFVETLSGHGIEIVAAAEPEPLGRGGGLRFAAAARHDEGPVFAINGDELLSIDLGALLFHHVTVGAAATITVTPLISSFGVVDLDGNLVTGFREAPKLPHWVSCGVYVLDEEALESLPERGDHEDSTFPELAAEGRLAAFRHDDLWLTVNTPKDLRAAERQIARDPGWLPVPRNA
jgi:NDP-sugar pyrophosphorylase family protein